MIGFQEFLTDEWKLQKYDSKRTGERLFADNHKEIEGYSVHTSISKNKEGHATVNYMVDGNYARSPHIDAKVGKKIVNHVGRQIHSYIRHVKPKSITFSSPNERRQTLHHHLSKHIARKFGGSVEVHQAPYLDTLHHTVHFK